MKSIWFSNDIITDKFCENVDNSMIGFFFIVFQRIKVNNLRYSI